jgi:tetratricopeptide (TPR) repeat protein
VVADWYCHLGNFAFEDKKWEQARDYFSRNLELRQTLDAVSDHPGSPNKLLSDAYYWMALTLEELGQFDEAEQLGARSEAIQPEDTATAAVCTAHLTAFYVKHSPDTNMSEHVASFGKKVATSHMSVDEFLEAVDDRLHSKYGQSLSEFLADAAK